MAGPLEGVRVLDLTAVVSGPLATMLLADQGADVIKVEPPGLGDLIRIGRFERGGLQAFYVNCNRGKRGIVVDLEREEGRALVRRLAARADVFAQNFRPGAIERLGLSEDELRRENPDLIYVSISGFGESGPYADRRVYDPIIQGITGYVAIQRHPEIGLPDLVRNIVCDKATAYTAAQAITAALFARERGAGGQHVRVPMVDAALAFFWPDAMIAQTMLGEGVAPGLPLYLIYRITPTADGHLIYFAATDKEWQGLFRATGHPEWCDDPRFTGPQRLQHLEFLGQALADAFSRHETADMLRRLADEGVPGGPVYGTLEEVFDDPQVKHNGCVFEREHPTAGRIREVNPGAHFSRTKEAAGAIAPLRGEHTEEVLAELGLDAAARADLRARGVVA
jgi:crotonobetainyl-CoA:carnitine CoA-transferase CaiB-like acyl-CoA transferase